MEIGQIVKVNDQIGKVVSIVPAFMPIKNAFLSPSIDFEEYDIDKELLSQQVFKNLYSKDRYMVSIKNKDEKPKLLCLKEDEFTIEVEQEIKPKKRKII